MKIAILFVVSTLLANEPGCDDHAASSEEKDQQIVDEQQKIYATTQPVPQFKWSQDRDNLIQIYKMKNEARTTHSVVRSQGTGQILWDCPSIGFPIPADTSLTNPLQIQWKQLNAYASGVIEQPEPNGLFSSKNTDGTYVICLDKDGNPSPQYTEEKVESFTRPILVTDGKVVFLDGASSMPLKIEKKAN